MSRFVLFDFDGVIGDLSAPADAALYDAMDQVVKHISEHYGLVIVTSATRRSITGFLEQHGLSDCFKDIYDADIDISKSKKIGMIFEKYEINASDCVMVTDSPNDVIEAREKSVDCIGVTWGLNSKEALVSADPWRIIELPMELSNAVAEFFHGKGTSA